MKKANSSGTNCTTRREAEELSPRLLETPGQEQPRSRKTIILFGPRQNYPVRSKILFKDLGPDGRYHGYVDKYDLEKLCCVSLRKARRLQPEQIRSRTDDNTFAYAITQGHYTSVRPAASDILSTREERSDANICAGA